MLARSRSGRREGRRSVVRFWGDGDAERGDGGRRSSEEEEALMSGEGRRCGGLTGDEQEEEDEEVRCMLEGLGGERSKVSRTLEALDEERGVVFDLISSFGGDPLCGDVEGSRILEAEGGEVVEEKKDLERTGVEGAVD